MRRPLVAAFILMISLLGMLHATRCQAGEEETRKDFERLAGQFQFFCGGEFLYDYPPDHRVPADMLPPYQKLLDEVTAPKHETSALLGLLKHKDPRVRTLAIAALYAKEDPKVLPQLNELCDDAAVTIPVPEPFAQFDFARDKLPALEERKVGRLASMIVGRYQECAGEPDFHRYWAARKDRTFCATWFEIQLDRVSQGKVPTPESRVKQVRAVRDRIDQLPKADRAWTLLWLSAANAPYHEVPSDEELLAACKDLGSDRLLAMLKRKIPSDDPDIQPRRNNNWQYQRMQLFVLRGADKVLRHDDAPALLACERAERDLETKDMGHAFVSPWFPIAAATLQPENAPQWLHDAIKRFNGNYDFEADNRKDLAEALWQLVGFDETEYLVTWFFKERPQMATFPHCRADFLRAAANEHGRAARKLIAQILSDKRFDSFNDWQSLTALIDIVNGWVDKPAVDAAGIAKARHPFQIARYYWWQERARKEYPKETEELEKTFAEWRAALRDSIPKWGE